jgi:mannose-6-phosphate isomerase-like protein (cupin superfamily)
MEPRIEKASGKKEFPTGERCWILENWNAAEDPAVSIAQARVEPGVTTQWHALDGVAERYVVIAGRGRMEAGDLPPAEIAPGDVVFIPAGVRQRVTNTAASDLVFYCICTPPFTPECYRPLEG